MGVQGPAPDWAPWLDQAEHDLYAARQNDASDLWDVAVTLAEQAAEKAAKAVWIDKRGELAPRIHFVGQLLRELGAPEELVKAGTALGDGYFTVRYPPLDGRAPFEAVDSADAASAVSDAERILQWAKEQLPCR
jgi:HEPN domain-containing protein